MSGSVRAHKAALRRELLSARRRRAELALAAADEAIALHAFAHPALIRPPRAACYLSLPEEPGTSALIEGLRARDVEVLVPVSHPSDHTLDWVVVDDTDWAIGAHGIAEPQGPRRGPLALHSCPVAFVPALAVDHAGRRLGRGAGYYDRALTDFTGLICAVVFAEELLERLPAEPHDIAVDLAVTPAGVFRPER